MMRMAWSKNFVARIERGGVRFSERHIRSKLKSDRRAASTIVPPIFTSAETAP